MPAPMRLIGQFDSPFTRRVGVTLTLYGLPFEPLPWSVFSDKAQISAFNPLLRVPTLVLADGTILTESFAILDYLDEQVAPAQRLTPVAGMARVHALRLCALACGVSDKAVSLFYEQKLHETPSPFYLARCTEQIVQTLQQLEMERAATQMPWLGGASLGQADITLACMLRHLREAHPDLFDPAALPALSAHAALCENLPVFQKISQPFIPPA